jgi:hypothetical protein
MILIAPWNEIWITKEVAMRLSKQMFARAERMRKRGHRAYAMFLRRDAKKVAQLEANLRASHIELGMALTERAVVIMKYEQLEEENEMFQELFVYFFGKNYERLTGER